VSQRLDALRARLAAMNDTQALSIADVQLQEAMNRGWARLLADYQTFLIQLGVHPDHIAASNGR
jgi:hypothetical protein